MVLLEFYNNYTQRNSNRNYKIYSVKYEDIFEKQDELSELLEIDQLNLVKKETNRTRNNANNQIETLNKVYKDLINDFIFIR